MNLASKSVEYVATLFASAMIGIGAQAAYTDGLVQYWDFSRGDTTDTAVEPAEIKDVLSWSSASPLTATRIDGAHPSDATKALKVPGRVCYTNMAVQLPFYGSITNNRTCLWIPQDTVDDNGTTKYCSRQVRLPAPATADNFGKCTVFLRFYLAKQNAGVTLHNIYSYGTAYNGTTGWGIVCQTSGSDGGSLNISYGNCWSRKSTVEVYGKKDPYQGGTFAYLQTGRWYDMVVTVDPSSSTDNVNLYLCQAGKWFRDPEHSYAADYQPDLYHYRMSVPISAPTSANNLQILGAGEDVNGWGAGEQSSWGTFDGFKHGVWGAFERVMVWNRILTKEEAYDAMADATGRNVEVGTKNGVADEFGKTGSSALVDVYDVETMSWEKLRKELTADNPSVSFKFAVPSREVGLARVLSVDPVLSGTGVAVPVAVSVNGEAVGELDLANDSKRALFIPGSFMTVDADGRTTVTLTRTTDLMGTAGIDHLSVGGSWQIGKTDGSEPFVDASFRNVSMNYVESFPIDDRYSTQFPLLLYGTNSMGACYTYRPYSLRFEIPAVMSERKSVFSLATLAESGTGYSYSHETVALVVNGTVAATLSGLKNGTAVNKIKLPAGTFRAGMNTIQIVNTTDVSKEASFWGTQSPVLKFAAHSLEFKEDRGLMLLFR